MQSAKESFRTSVFCAIIDKLTAELNCRKVVYADLNQRFAVLVEWNDADGNAIRRMANTLQQAYPDDLDDDFANEIEQYVVYAKENPDMMAKNSKHFAILKKHAWLSPSKMC